MLWYFHGHRKNDSHSDNAFAVAKFQEIMEKESLHSFLSFGRNYSATKRKIGPKIRVLLVYLLGIYDIKTVTLEYGKIPFPECQAINRPQRLLNVKCNIT